MAEERDEPRAPTEEELRAALDRVAIGDVLVQSLTAAASLAFRKLSREARDLPQARLAIEALRALEPVLREGGVEEQVVRDLEQARVNLQLAYAKAVAEAEREQAARAGEAAAAGQEAQAAEAAEAPAEPPGEAPGEAQEPSGHADEGAAGGEEPGLDEAPAGGEEDSGGR